MWYLPWGLVSARWGTRAATRLKSSRSRSTRASLAMASRWSTALVEPPRAMVTAMAFSKASLVMIWRGRMPARSSATTACPEAKAASSRRRSTAGADELPGSDMPSASATDAMVLAVNMPAHDPSVGQALCSMRLSSSSLSASTAWAPTASKTEVMSRARSPARPGRMEPAVEEDAGQVEPGGRHQHARQRLVAAGQGDQAVEPLGVHHRLHRVGDDLAADQRGPHALVAHGDAVGDGDGHELEREPAGVADALLGPLGQPVEGEVARGDLVPGRGHADLRLVPVVVGHPDRPQHGPGRGPGGAVGDLVAAGLHPHQRLLRRIGGGRVAHACMVRPPLPAPGGRMASAAVGSRSASGGTARAPQDLLP